jgi:hypothetical protein
VNRSRLLDGRLRLSRREDEMIPEAVSDMWVIGEGAETGTAYLIRLEPPRCVIQVEEVDDTALLLPRMMVNRHDEAFGVLMWLDRDPDADAHDALLEEAISVYEAFVDSAQE